MTKPIRVLIASFALLFVSVPLALASESGAPKVDGRSAQNVTSSTAILRARIDPNSDNSLLSLGDTTYKFQYGRKGSSMTATPVGIISGLLGPTDVSFPVTGLAAGSEYNFRAVASNGAGTTTGPLSSFKTSGKATPSDPSSGSAKGTDDGKGFDNGAMPDVPGDPEVGQSVAVAVTTGTVKVRVRGTDEFRDLAADEMIPLNSTFDTSAGKMLLEAEDKDGKTYTGAFHGGQFTVHQSSNGATTLELKGGDISACGSSRKGRATSSAAHPVLRKLWGKDHGGKFKTSSRGSVATVRGTEWLTVDRCDGTLTKVTHGKVLVRERGTGRSKLLHKGEKFFAHLPH